jgi:hypothetical protein
MKKNALLIVAACTFMSGTMFTSCSTSEEKVAHAESDVRAADKKLLEAKEDYRKDMETYRQETALKMAIKQKKIAEFKTIIASKKKDAKAEYEKTLLEIELSNDELKKSIADYQDSGKDSWNEFRASFEKQMEENSAKFEELLLKSAK